MGISFTGFTADPIMNVGAVFFCILFVFIVFMGVTIIIALFRKEEQGKFTPEASVIIPCYNEEQNIWQCLTSVRDCGYPREKYEIIVVDDGSKDRSIDLISRFKRENPGIRLSLLRQEHKGKSAGINNAIRHSKMPFIVTIDADTMLEKDCLLELLSPMGRKEVGAVNGVSLAYRPRNILERFQDAEYHYNNLIRVGFTRVFDSGIWFFSATASYRRSIFGDEDLFNGTLTEDMDIALRISGKGYKVLTSSRAIGLTRVPSTLKQLFGQRMRWWFGVLISLVKNRNVLARKPTPSIVFLYINQFWWSFYAIFSLPIFIYQILYWLPKSGALDIVSYLVRWFSLWGPFYVLYKIPEWGVSAINIFGVMSGVVSAALILLAYRLFRKKIGVWDIITLVFYFPYTIILNLVIVFSLFRYGLSKKKVFID